MVKFPTDIPVPADDDDEAALRLLAALSDEDAPKANGQPRFARTRDAWLKMVLAERRLTASDIRLCVALFLHFNFKRYAKTDKLLAWPSLASHAQETANVTIATEPLVEVARVKSAEKMLPSSIERAPG
jgi:hypothetical protein